MNILYYFKVTLLLEIVTIVYGFTIKDIIRKHDKLQKVSYIVKNSNFYSISFRF